MRIGTIATILVSGLLPLLGQAQGTENQLLEWLNTPVTVAGKKAQSISKAPAIISVITAEELRQMGVTNLYEALSLLPGINLTETSFGYTSVSMRGNLQTHYNNKSLVLINNHPTYDTAVGTFYLEQIPINMVKRIEILRGPGSTLYGTNAFTGVVKVITKDAEDIGRGEVAVGGGSYGGKLMELATSASGDHFKLAAGASYVGSGGYPYKVLKDENGRAGTLDYRDNVKTGFVASTFYGVQLNLNYWQMDKDKFGLIPTLVSTGVRVNKGFFADVTRTWTFSDKLSLTAFGYFDNVAKVEDIAWYPPAYAQQQAGVGGPERQDVRGDKLGADVQLTWNPSESVRVIAGAFYEKQYSGQYLWRSAITGQFTPFKTSAWFGDKTGSDSGGYVQVDGTLLPWLSGVLGVRFSKNDVYGNKTTPSVGLVASASDALIFKILYGKAFRNPSIFEKYVSTVNTLFGDANLLPEDIKALEVGMDWFITAGNSLRVNVFSTSTDELITRSKIIPAGQQGNTRDTPQYGNSKGQDIKGLEAENKGALGKGFKYFVNVSFLKGTEKKNDADIMYIPKFTGNLGFTVELTEQFELSAYYQMIGKKEGKLANGTPNTVDAYALAHLNLVWKPTKHLWASLAVRNALDKTWAYPEYVRNAVPSTPGGPDRSVMAKVGYRF